MTASRVAGRCPSPKTPEGADGWAPIHSSASGPGDGTGRPWSSAIDCLEPHG